MNGGASALRGWVPTCDGNRAATLSPFLRDKTRNTTFCQLQAITEVRSVSPVCSRRPLLAVKNFLRFVKFPKIAAKYLTNESAL